VTSRNSSANYGHFLSRVNTAEQCRAWYIYRFLVCLCTPAHCAGWSYAENGRGQLAETSCWRPRAKSGVI